MLSPEMMNDTCEQFICASTVPSAYLCGISSRGNFPHELCKTGSNVDLCSYTGTGESKCINLFWNNYNWALQCWEGHEILPTVECAKCKKGRYRGNSNQGAVWIDFPTTHCSACPPGKYADADGHRECIPCSAGKYSVACEVGSERSGPLGGCMSCEDCPMGTYQSNPGSSICKPCETGKYGRSLATTEGSKCLVCPAGQYAKDPASTSCQKCPAGFFTDAPGTSLDGQPDLDHTNCKICGEGKFALSDGSSKCEDCPIGFVASRQGSKTCTLCEAGQETNTKNLPGGSQCVSCNAGKFF